MIVGELIDELKKCNEKATVSSILQSSKDYTLYEAKVLIAEIGEGNEINIFVREINDKGISVKDLLEFLVQYDETLPIFIKEWSLSPPRRSFEILNVKKNDEIIFLEIPQRLADIAKEGV